MGFGVWPSSQVQTGPRWVAAVAAARTVGTTAPTPREPVFQLSSTARQARITRILAALGSLRIEHLFLVTATTGVLTVLFDVAYRS